MFHILLHRILSGWKLLPVSAVVVIIILKIVMHYIIVMISFPGFCCMKLIVKSLVFTRSTSRSHTSCFLCLSKALLLGEKNSRNERVKSIFQNIGVMLLI